MIYGGEPPTTQPPAKVCNTQTMPLVGPGAYSYGLLAKQPGSNYKIRMRDMERLSLERFNANLEENYKITNRQNQHLHMIQVADQKYFYKRIKKMVDDEMKANEHLFREECPKQDIEENEKEPEVPKLSIEEKQAILEESKRKKHEETRNTVKEKRLQQFIENSGDLRTAAVRKRQKLISDFNYKTIREKEIAIKEEKIKKRQLANSENMELFKSQLHEMEGKKRKQFEEKEQFLKDLRMQLDEKEILREQERKLKNVERNDFMKLKEKLDEEIEFEKHERIRNRKRIKEEITRLIEDRIKIFSKVDEMRSNLNNYFVATYRDYFNQDAAFDHCEAKVQVRRENEIFMNHYLMINEERKKQEDEKSRIRAKQIKDIEDLKLSVERQNDESRRKRLEEGNKILMEQLKASEALVEQQKEIKRQVYEESVKNYDNYLKDVKETCERDKQKKMQFRIDLKDQIDSRKREMEEQKVIEKEKHRKHLLELAKQEELLQKLLKEVSIRS